MFKKYIYNYLLSVTLFFGLIIRFISINQSLWMDEAISAKAAKYFGYISIITDFIKADTHPPFYYLFLKFWTGIFGFSELALRTPSIIFGVLTIFVVYKIGGILSRKTGLFAAILTAFSPLLIYYSQEARMYALSTLLVSVCAYFFIKKYWWPFSISLLLLSITDYLPLFILIPFWLIIFAGKNYRKDRIKFFLSHVPLIIFFILWLPTFNIQRSSTLSSLSELPAWGNLIGTSSLKNLALVWVKFLIGRINFVPSVLYVFIVLIVSVLTVYGLYWALKNYKNTYYYFLWLVLPIFSAFILSFRIPAFSYFRLIFVLPAFLILIANGLSATKKGNYIFIIFLAAELIFSSIYLFKKDYWREDWKNAIPFIEERLKPDEVVFISYPETFTPYEWYSMEPEKVKSFYTETPEKYNRIYTLDYLMDLTSSGNKNYILLRNLGFKNTEVYNFRGVGQVRYWIKT
jgi:uncharacterized membrane protein